LPKAKADLFVFTQQDLEVSYVSLSVSLNDAFTLCNERAFWLASEQAGMFADLFDRLAAALRGVLRALYEHGNSFGTTPNFAPLRADCFRSARAQQIARTNSMFSFLILRSRNRFFRKLAAVEQIVADLRHEGRNLVAGIAVMRDPHIMAEWRRLEILHYDLNTCLRETVVMLKSFFCVLPPEELPDFRAQLQPVSATEITSRMAEPRLKATWLRSAEHTPLQQEVVAGEYFSKQAPLPSYRRDNSGSGDGITLTRIRPDGTSGPNETN
jgi:hypothetical protein